MLKLISLVSIFLISSCGSSKIKDMSELCFGNYGGFAGSYTEYCIAKDGVVREKTGYGADYSTKGEIQKKEVKQIYEAYMDKGIDTIVVNEPGNLTYFIEMKKEKDTIKQVWGRQIGKDKELRGFYKSLMTKVKDLNEVR